MLSVRASVHSDAENLAPILRMEDVEEVYAASGSTPLAALTAGVVFSDQCWTFEDQDGPVGMFGVVRVNMLVGSVWMLASPRLEKHAVQFLRGNKRTTWMDTLHQSGVVLWNHVDERNTKHIRWLKWLGFTFIMRHPHYGFERRPFLEFVRLQPNV